MMEVLLLSRLQFAWVVAMHILLPAFTVGLAAYIAVLEGAHFFTRRPVFRRIAKFWAHVTISSRHRGVTSVHSGAFHRATIVCSCLCDPRSGHIEEGDG